MLKKMYSVASYIISIIVLFVFMSGTLSGCSRLHSRPSERLPEPPSEVAHANPNIDYTQSPAMGSMSNDLPAMSFDPSSRLPAEPVQVRAEGQYSAELKLMQDEYYHWDINPLVRTTYPAEQRMPLSVRQDPYLPNIQAFLWEPAMTLQDSMLSGNLFLEWRVENGGKQHIITLREGLCWSDGTPVTAYDIQFALQTFNAGEPFYLGPKKANTVEPRRSQVWGLLGDRYGALPEIRVSGTYTCTLTCVQADPGLPWRVANAENGYLDVLMPSHFLKNLHIAYTDYKAVWTHMREMGLLPWPSPIEITNARFEGDPVPENPDPSESWAWLFWKILDARIGNDRYTFPEWAAQIPTLSAWMLPVSFEGNTDASGEAYYAATIHPTLSLVRNPYYHKVDSEGQQLPYYDRVGFYWSTLNQPVQYAPIDLNDYACPKTVMAGVPCYDVTEEVSVAKDGAYYAYASAYNIASPRLAQTVNTNKWIEHTENILGIIAEQKGIANTENVGMRQWEEIEATTGYAIGLAFQYGSDDERWNNAVADRVFRQALSSAINRDRICSLVFNDYAQPAQWVPNRVGLPDMYKGIDVPVLLQLQNVLPFEDYDRMLDLIVEDLQAIGLNAYRMDESQSTAYQNGTGTRQPALTLLLTPPETRPTPYVPVPESWTDANAEEKAFADEVLTLRSVDVDTLFDMWPEIGEQVTALQPFIPLVDHVEAFLYKVPALQGNTGDTLIDQYHSMALWWEME